MQSLAILANLLGDLDVDGLIQGYKNQPICSEDGNTVWYHLTSNFWSFLTPGPVEHRYTYKSPRKEDLVSNPLLIY